MPKAGNTHHAFQVGDIVALSESFVDRHGRYANSMPLARGKVKAMHRLDKVTLADVDWDKPGLPKRMNVKNLILKTDIPAGE